MAKSQALRDSERSTVLIRIEESIIRVIRRFANKNEATVKGIIEEVLRERFCAEVRK